MADTVLVYIASPYSDSDLAVMQARYEVVRDVTLRIICEQKVVIPYSPIAYTHQFGEIGGIDWYEWDFKFLQRCDSMLVVQMEGWENSVGIEKELDYCKRFHIPVFYATVDRVLEVCREIPLTYIGVSLDANGLADCGDKVDRDHFEGLNRLTPPSLISGRREKPTNLNVVDPEDEDDSGVKS